MNSSTLMTGSEWADLYSNRPAIFTEKHLNLSRADRTMKLYVTIIALVNFLCLPHRQANASISCPPGTFLKNKACQLCPPGTYQSKNNSATECIQCFAGYFNQFSGAQVDNFCQPCPENTFSAPGSASCKPCPPGTISDRYGSTCSACGPGYSLQSEQCKKCYKGSYSSNPLNRQCTPCPRFETTDGEGSTSQAACKALPCIKQQTQACEECDEGMFFDFVKRGCYPCPRGTFSNTRSATKCTECAKGTSARYRWSTECEKCPAGFVALNTGEFICRRKGFPCPSTAFRDRKGRCKMCERNQHLNARWKICVDCPPGQFSDGGTVTKCKACRNGFVYSEKLHDCVCPAGTVQTRNGPCRKCPVGTYRDSPESGPICQSCYQGSIAPRTGAIECEKCPPGTYQPLKGQTKCIMCPTGTFQKPFYPNECVSIQTFCPPGYERRDVYGSKCIPLSCPLDTFAVQGSYGLECKKCFPGQRYVRETNSCVQCAEDEISSGGLTESCTKCPRGMVRYKPEGDICKCIKARYGWQGRYCKKCPKGTFYVYYKDTCTKCPAGTFTNREGSYGGCTMCEAGTVSNEGAVQCTACPSGSISYGLQERSCVFPFKKQH